MFPLDGPAFPASAEELTASLESALRRLFRVDRPGPIVRVQGGTWPALERVTVDLAGAALHAPGPPPRPGGAHQRPGFFVRDWTVSAPGVRTAGAAGDLELTARDVRLDYDLDERAGQALLVLAGAGQGRVRAATSKRDLEALLLAAARAGAAEHGVSIERTTLELESLDSRAVRVAARVEARKVVRVNIDVTGRLTVDEQLVATLSNLECGGSGLVGSMVAGLVRRHLAPLEGRRVPLQAFALGDVRLRDLELAVRDGIEVTAAFSG